MNDTNNTLALLLTGNLAESTICIYITIQDYIPIREPSEA